MHSDVQLARRLEGPTQMATPSRDASAFMKAVAFVIAAWRVIGAAIGGWPTAAK
jgi:hypothetical protein